MAGLPQTTTWSARLRRALARPEPPGPVELPGRQLRPAAVLVPLLAVAVPHAPRVVFTVRTESMGSHKGQVSFPGGSRDPGDATPVATALREAWEELGLHPADVAVLGLLDEHVTGTGFRITPVVGWIARYPYPFRPNAAEVAEVLEVPLDHLLEPSSVIVRSRITADGRQVTDYAYPWGRHLIWGITGRILFDLLQRLRACPGPSPV